jgi:hypothetical protein
MMNEFFVVVREFLNPKKLAKIPYQYTENASFRHFVLVLKLILYFKKLVFVSFGLLGRSSGELADFFQYEQRIDNVALYNFFAHFKGKKNDEHKPTIIFYCGLNHRRTIAGNVMDIPKVRNI